MKLLGKPGSVPKDTSKKESIEISVTIPIEPKVETPPKIKLFRPVNYPISSPYGPRQNPLKPNEIKMHKGVDFACPVGTPVLACIDSKVYRVGFEDPNHHRAGMGLRIWTSFMKDGEKYYLWYGHLSEVHVGVRDELIRGQIIGVSGNSGRTTGPHLHLQIRKENTQDYYDMEFYDISDTIKSEETQV